MEKDYVDELEEQFTQMYANKYTLEQLNEIKNRLIKMNEDSSIIDKAINIKLKYQSDKEKEEKEFERKVRIVNKQAFWSGLLGGLASGKIEDEDDFYSDDLD